MSLYDDLRPFVKFSMIFGLSPYSLSSVDVKLSRIGMAYSSVCAIGHGYLVYLRYEDLAGLGVDEKLRFLTVMRTALSACALFVDIFVCAMWHRKLQAALIFMQRYDHAVKLTATPRPILVRCWLGLLATLLYFLFLGWLTYVYESETPFESAIIYFALYTAITSSILKFSAIAASLLYRFRHLNAIIKSGAWRDQPGWCRRPLNLRDAWCLHSSLVSAAEEVNALYSAQLLLWVAGLTLNIISRIYAIFDAHDSLNVLKICREIGLAAAFTVLLTILAGVCHVTAAEANKVGAVAFSPGSSIFRNRREYSNSKIEESMHIGLYFMFHRLHFSAACGLLQVDLPLLQSIAGATTTYLVILKSPG